MSVGMQLGVQQIKIQSEKLQVQGFNDIADKVLTQDL